MARTATLCGMANVRLLILFLSLLVACRGSALAAGDDLVGVWHFDEATGSALLDATRAENDGECRGARRTAEGALEFDGKSAYVTLGGYDALPAATVELWAKIPAAGTGQTGVICFGRPYGHKSDTVLLGFGMPDGKPGVLSLGVCANRWVQAQSAFMPKPGQWCHLAAVFASDGLRLYADGELVASSDQWKGGLPAHEAILLGASSWKAHQPCTVEELRIYRRALDAQEIRSHAKDRRYFAEPPQPPRRTPATRPSISAADFVSNQSFTAGIQEAIDHLPRRGGVVLLPPGTYPVRRSIILRSNIVLRGSGPATVLQRPAQARSRLTAIAKPGDTSLAVENVNGFEVGADVAILDNKHGGWYVAHRKVFRVENKVIHLDRPLERDYDPARQAVILNYFPGILVDGKEGVIIEDLRLDGRHADNTGPESDFTVSAIHLVSSSDCIVRACRVESWPGDGISVQGGGSNRVTDCTVERCRGHGFHPGTSLRGGVFSRNIARHNAWDGLFFCMEVRHLIVSDNLFEANGWNGIGGLGNGGDKFNIVQGNVCAENAQCGILANDGANNSITGNICIGNSVSKPAAYPGIRLHNVTDMTVTGNRCGDDQKKTQSTGIEEDGASDRNLVVGNNCRGNAGAGVKVIGKNSTAANNAE